MEKWRKCDVTETSPKNGNNSSARAHSIPWAGVQNLDAWVLWWDERSTRRAANGVSLTECRMPRLTCYRSMRLYCEALWPRWKNGACEWCWIARLDCVRMVELSLMYRARYGIEFAVTSWAGWRAQPGFSLSVNLGARRQPLRHLPLRGNQ